jgi:purine-binding chemotaxis protein CheW
MSAPAPAERAVPENIVQLCAFIVSGEEYVIDIMRIREIIPPQRITPVPHAPAFLEGVINLRGAIVPVVDLSHRLGQEPAPPTRRTKLVICSVGGRRVGLLVDAVTEVRRIPRASIKRPPRLLVGGGPRFFLGVCGPAERLKLLLNVKALLESPLPVPGAQVRALAREGPGQQG